jgi:putative tryptophan/tyrosine transport system substrate-binding protein
MERRTFLAGTGAVLLAAPLAAEGQQPAGRMIRIGLLDSGSDPASVDRWQAFRERLRELGYVEGRNVVFESRSAGEQVGRLPSLAKQLIDAKADILVTASSEAALAAKRATSSIPVVTATGTDPVALGLVASLARPGGNVPGVYSAAYELAAKRVDLLKQLIPQLSRLALLRNPDNRGSTLMERAVESAAKTLGVTVQMVGVRSPKDLDAAFVAIKNARAEAVIVTENTAWFSERRRIADLAVTHRLPLSVMAKEYAEAGAFQLRPRLSRTIQARRRLRGSDPQGRQAGRSPRRAADEVRAGHQPQDRQGVGTDDPAVGAGAGG